MATLLTGVKSGHLHQGHFNANQYNYLEVRGIFTVFGEDADCDPAGQRPRPCVRPAGIANRPGEHEPRRAGRRRCR